MHKEGMGYRRISDFLNRSGIKTHTNKTWSNSKVHSNLKRMQERKERIAFRNKTYPSVIKNLRIKIINASNTEIEYILESNF